MLKKREGSSSGTTKIEVTDSQLAKIKRMMKKEKRDKQDVRDDAREKRLLATLEAKGLLKKSDVASDTGTQKNKKAKTKKSSTKDGDDNDDDDDESDDGDDTEEAPTKKPKLSRVQLKKVVSEMKEENQDLTAHLSAIVGRPSINNRGIESYSDGEIDGSPAKGTRQSKRAINAARRLLLRKSPTPSPVVTPKPSPKKSTRKVVVVDKSDHKEKVEETPTKMSCADLMAMAKNRCGKKTFHTQTKKQQAQALLDSLSGAIRLVVTSNPGADFTAKVPPAFEEHLEPFVTRCLEILTAAGKAEKRAKLLYITALKDGVLRDGPISIVTSGRESDASLLTRVVFGFLDNGINIKRYYP